MAQSPKLILALDGKPWNEFIPLLEKLRNTGVIFKINDLILEKDISALISTLHEYGEVMIDLKWHDIPKTIRNYGLRICTLAPWAVTIHASGGSEMIKTLADTLKGTRTKILAVTLLTSLDTTDSIAIYQEEPLEHVKKLAALAIEAGAHGLVCSPHEASFLRKLYPSSILVTPGVRLETHASEKGRTATPQEAIIAGAHYIVMGRDIIEAENPFKAVEKVLGELSEKT